MYTPMMIKVGILGAGSFGTALAIMFSKFVEVTLFSGFEEHANSMKKTRKNEFLEGFVLASNIDIDVIYNIEKKKFDYILWCFPVIPSISILNSIKKFLNNDYSLIICSKGICESGKFIYDEFVNLLPETNIGLLSGPNLAYDIAQLKFSAADIGFKDISLSLKAAKDLSNDYFKLFPNSDIPGMQIAGVIKNVIAIAAGILKGLDLGQNAFAILVTEGIKEMLELGKFMGAKTETFYGLSGVGDLILTVFSKHSRNLNYGIMLAQGEKKETKAVCEGAECIGNLMKLVNKYNINIPICKLVHDIIEGNKTADSIIEVLKDI